MAKKVKRPTTALAKKSTAEKARKKAVSTTSSSRKPAVENRHDRLMKWPLRTAYRPTLKPNRKNVAASRQAAKFFEDEGYSGGMRVRMLVKRVKKYEEAAMVEGYIIRPGGGVTEHTWLVYGGEIIDPLYPDFKTTYFPGVEFVGKKTIDEFDAISVKDGWRERTQPFFFAFGWGGHYNPHMLAAYLAAVKHEGFADFEVFKALEKRAREL
jgi:hypothetical protein